MEKKNKPSKSIKKEMLQENKEPQGVNEEPSSGIKWAQQPIAQKEGALGFLKRKV